MKSCSAPAFVSNIHTTRNNLPAGAQGRLDAVPREELLARPPHVRPPAHDARRRRQPLEDQPAVALGDDAAVEQNHGADVAAGPNQSPEALFQLERAVRLEEE